MNMSALIAVVATLSVVGIAGLAVASGPSLLSMTSASGSGSGSGMMGGGMMHQSGSAYQNQNGSGTCPMGDDGDHDWNYSNDYGGCPCRS